MTSTILLPMRAVTLPQNKPARLTLATPPPILSTMATTTTSKPAPVPSKVLSSTPTPASSSSSSLKSSNISSSKSSTLANDQTQDIPIFLRKTYHMVDTCDPTICSWSEDGETFVVMDPSKFESVIIPQFFKHSKFSSFVRQLNFYSFRKIRYADTIRIDPKLEAETANYWRFFHPKFQRGRPEWLSEIKRMTSTPRADGAAAAAAAVGASAVSAAAVAKKPTTPVPSKAVSGGGAAAASVDPENLQLKTEVTSLKERIEAMTKNIDQLTTMVQLVTLKHAEEADKTGSEGAVLNENHKRPKTTDAVVGKALPDSSSSSSMDFVTAPASQAPPSMPSPTRISGDDARQREQSSASTELSDDGFVDQLFTAFKGDAGDFAYAASEDDGSFPGDRSSSPFLMASSSAKPEYPSSTNNESNRPASDLMSRLSDALSLLPRDIQELIVNRLIEAILSPKEVQESIQVVHALEQVMQSVSSASAAYPMSVPQSPKHELATFDADSLAGDDVDALIMMETDEEDIPGPAPPTPAALSAPSLSLTAATLAALLAQYSKEHHNEYEHLAAAAAAHHKSKEAKSLLIPVHA